MKIATAVPASFSSHLSATCRHYWCRSSSISGFSNPASISCPTEALPSINAALNGCATVLLTAGFICIRSRREQLHHLHGRGLQCFHHLFTHVLHKILVQGVHTLWRRRHLAQHLLWHADLAHHTGHRYRPLVLTTLTLAIKGNRERHKVWAKWTFPIWYYVSVTGVLVYFFLQCFNLKLS